MNVHQAFATLREVLAFLYETEEDARRVASDTGLDTQHISFGGKAINNWNAILFQAQREGKTTDLMGVTFREFRENEELSKAWHDYLMAGGKKGVDGSLPTNSEKSKLPASCVLQIGIFSLVVTFAAIVLLIIIKIDDGLPGSVRNMRAPILTAIAKLNVLEDHPSPTPRLTRTPTLTECWPVHSITTNNNNSPNVSAIQYLLNRRGYPLDITGIYDAATESQIKVYQIAHQLSPNGVVDKNTLQDVIRRDLQQGQIGKDVSALQHLLNYKFGYSMVKVDADFGPRTHEAVVLFQEAHGLDPTGVVQLDTWSALFCLSEGFE